MACLNSTAKSTQTQIHILLHILCQTPIFINQVCAQFNKKILTYKWFFIKTPFVLGMHASLPPLLPQPLWKENPQTLSWPYNWWSAARGKQIENQCRWHRRNENEALGGVGWVRGGAATLSGQTVEGANTRAQGKLSPSCLLHTPLTLYLSCTNGLGSIVLI